MVEQRRPRLLSLVVVSGFVADVRKSVGAIRKKDADRGAGGPWGLVFALLRAEMFRMKVFLPQSPRTPIAAAGSFRRRGARG